MADPEIDAARVAGKRVVDLGCGFGWFCRFAREAGAATVLGLDVSANMLARAREMTSDPAITYRASRSRDARAARRVVRPGLQLPHVALPREARRAVRHGASRACAGGHFVFSAEHPLYTEPGPDYLDEGPRTTDWLAQGVLKQHRTLATYLNLLIAAGFTVRRVEEWGPTREEIAAHPEWKIDHRRPSFLLVSATR